MTEYEQAKAERRAELAAAYSNQTMTPEQARRLMWECAYVAGIFPLSCFSVAGVYDAAKELWKDHPRLRELCKSATERVYDKWNGDCEDESAATDWATDLVAEYAKDLGIILEAADENAEDEAAT